jgi:hypothetical protein
MVEGMGLCRDAMLVPGTLAGPRDHDSQRDATSATFLAAAAAARVFALLLLLLMLFMVVLLTTMV